MTSWDPTAGLVGPCVLAPEMLQPISCWPCDLTDVDRRPASLHRLRNYNTNTVRQERSVHMVGESVLSRLHMCTCTRDYIYSLSIP